MAVAEVAGAEAVAAGAVVAEAEVEAGPGRRPRPATPAAEGRS